jgi:DNA-binding IclR family transcriptional regulator
MSLFGQLVDSKIIKIVKVLLNNPTEFYHIQKLAKEAKVPLSSTHRLVNKLVRINLIKITTVGQFKIYQINETNIEELKLLLGEKK